MEGAERRPEARLHIRMIAIVERGARMHVAREHPGRDIGRRGDGLAKPDRAQHPDRLRADIDAGADLAEMRRGLENLSREAEFGERCRRRQPGKTAANNGDAWNLAHPRSQTLRTPAHT